MIASATIQIDAAKLRERRQNLGLRQEDVAAKAGVKQRYISDIERGAHNPTAPKLKAIADALGCEPSDLRAAS